MSDVGDKTEILREERKQEDGHTEGGAGQGDVVETLGKLG